MSLKGKVLSVCTSPEKGTKKTEVLYVHLVKDWGIKGDAHAGAGLRHVSFLSAEDIGRMKKVIPSLQPGDFGENIVTQGVDLHCLKIGDRIIIGNKAIVEVSQVGKECHRGCQIQRMTGKCIMPERGIFARVLRGGLVRKNTNLRIQTTDDAFHQVARSRKI